MGVESWGVVFGYGVGAGVPVPRTFRVSGTEPSTVPGPLEIFPILGICYCPDLERLNSVTGAHRWCRENFDSTLALNG